MRKPISVILALLIALFPIFACAEGPGLSALMTSTSNRNLGNENSVYAALHKILAKANWDPFPMAKWMTANTYLSKISTGEQLTEDEVVADESLSAYEKFFLLSLSQATLSEEEAGELTTFFEEGLKAFPEETGELYVSSEHEPYLTDLMRQAMEKLGYQYVPEVINDTLTLYAIKDAEDNIILSAPEVLTSLPHAMLMKLVPAEKRQASAAALARVEASIPYRIDWQKLNGGDDPVYDNLDGLDDFFEDSDEEDDADEEGEGDASVDEAETKIVLTEEQIAEWTEKWLKLYYACDAYDLSPDEDNYKLVTDAIYAMTEDKPEVTMEPDGGISLRYDESASPTATPAPSKSSSSTSATKAPAKVLVNLPGSYASYTGKYIIYVSKKSCTIAIIGRDSNKQFTKKIKTFPTAIGKAGQTRSGIYWLYKKERWHSWGTSYSPYCVKQSGGSYIHGPMYTAKDSNKMIPSSYNAIGTRSSAGCLSTVCAAAGWIYYNCPVKTMVYIADDSKFTSKKPKKIPSDQTYDPTESGVKPTNTGGQTIIPPTPTPTKKPSNTQTPEPDSTQTPEPDSTQTPEPDSTQTPEPESSQAPEEPPTTTDIKQLQSLLTLYYASKDLPLDLADEIGSEIGAKTKEAMETFCADYSSNAGGANLPTPSGEERAPITDLIDKLTQQQTVQDKIAEIQVKLVELTLLSAEDKTAANGTLDEKTLNAIKSFQGNNTNNGLNETGVVDAKTLEKLFSTSEPQDVYMTRISVSPTTLNLVVGGTESLSATPDPENSTNVTSFGYNSDNPEVATVDNNGNVTAVAEGTTNITVTANLSGGSEVDSVTVKVTVTTSSYPTVARGSSDKAAVKEIQTHLVILGKLEDGTEVDGSFGPGTEEAVKDFQGSNGLDSTGEVDMATHNKLLSAAKSTITEVQNDLIKLEYLDASDFDEEQGGTLEKGVYDSTTQDNVKDFQKAYNKDFKDTEGFEALEVTGIADTDTQEALQKKISANNAPETEVPDTLPQADVNPEDNGLSIEEDSDDSTDKEDNDTSDDQDTDDKSSDQSDESADDTDDDDDEKSSADTEKDTGEKKSDEQQSDVKDSESKSEETSKEDSSKEETAKEETSKEDSSKEEASKEETAKEEKPKEETSKQETAKEEKPKEEAKQETAKEEKPKEEAKQETVKEEKPKEEKPKEEKPKEEKPKEEAPKEEAAPAPVEEDPE